MKEQVFNPYLPGYEYIPDGEPRVFQDRVYVYGSHDKFNGPIFCINDYVCWSAPTDDLSAWRYEGVIYKRNQDPRNKLGLRLLFAPDVVQGADGRYYLYYAFDFMGIMGVAVCDTPAGKYEFLGHVHYPDGTLLGRKAGDHFPFDPGVLVDDDGRVYLYSGFAVSIPPFVTGFRKLKSHGGTVTELEKDMLTIKKKPRLLFPKEGKGSFTGHEFFEASSIRKDHGKYYFVYSSKKNYELCYGVSDYPDHGFSFGGILVSQGDFPLNGTTAEKDGVNYLGNTHGGLLKLEDQWYIFYHRQTNRHSYSRQACAERIFTRWDGSFAQAEVTSCGLNNGPLRDKGRYEARIACNLWSKDGVGRYDCRRPRKRFAEHPYFTQDPAEKDEHSQQYIANMRDGAVAGFKYFLIESPKKLSVEIRGKAQGKILVADEKSFSRIVAEIPVSIQASQWKTLTAELKIKEGRKALYFRFTGKGRLDFLAFTIR